MQSYLCDVQFCAKIELRFATTVPFLMLFRGQGSSKATTQGDKILTKAYNVCLPQELNFNKYWAIEEIV